MEEEFDEDIPFIDFENEMSFLAVVGEVTRIVDKNEAILESNVHLKKECEADLNYLCSKA